MLGGFGQVISLILLLRVSVSQFPFPLCCHPSLGLHELLGFVVSPRGLMSLRSVEGMKTGWLRAASLIEGVDGVRARDGTVGDSEVGAASTHSITLAGLLKILIGAVDLVKLVGIGKVILRLGTAGTCSTSRSGGGGALMIPIILGRARPLRTVVVGHGFWWLRTRSAQSGREQSFFFFFVPFNSFFLCRIICMMSMGKTPGGGTRSGGALLGRGRGRKGGKKERREKEKRRREREWG